MATRHLSSMRLVQTIARRGVAVCTIIRNVPGMARIQGGNSLAGGTQLACRGLTCLDLSMSFGSMNTTRRTASTWNRVVVSASREVSNQRQPLLSNAEKKVLRQKAQRMQDTLVTVNAGDKGLTVNFLSGLFDALKANQLVKVRMGCSRQEKKTKTEELERILDCVCVHSIGSVVILFRQKGLSTPQELADLLRGDTGLPDENVVKKKAQDVKASTRANIPDEFKVIES